MRFRPTLLILAAGSGGRFGGPSQQLAQPLGNTTVLGHTVRNATQTLLPILLVTTPLLAPLARSLAAQRDVLLLSHESVNWGQAIAAGVAERSGAPGWLVVPGDLPLVQPKSLLAMASALEENAIVQPEFEGQTGTAVGFSAELYSELVKLQDDEGARRIVARYPVHRLAVNDPGVVQGAGNPSELDLLRAIKPVAGAPTKV
jgi:molybdenum cofactor cytidylyltransferase